MAGACGRNVAGTGLPLSVSGAGSYLCVVFLIWLLGGWLCTCRQIQKFHGFSSNLLISKTSKSFFFLCMCGQSPPIGENAVGQKFGDACNKSHICLLLAKPTSALLVVKRNCAKT